MSFSNLTGRQSPRPSDTARSVLMGRGVFIVPRPRKELELQTQALRGWLKVKEAAVYCDMSERTIRSWLKDGLRHSRLRSGTILIKVEWIDEFLSSFEAQENETDRIVDDVMRGL